MSSSSVATPASSSLGATTSDVNNDTSTKKKSQTTNTNTTTNKKRHLKSSSSLASIQSSLQSELSKVNHRITETEKFLSGASSPNSPSASQSDFGPDENADDADRVINVMDSLRAISERKSHRRTPEKKNNSNNSGDVSSSVSKKLLNEEDSTPSPPLTKSNIESLEAQNVKEEEEKVVVAKSKEQQQTPRTRELIFDEVKQQQASSSLPPASSKPSAVAEGQEEEDEEQRLPQKQELKKEIKEETQTKSNIEEESKQSKEPSLSIKPKQPVTKQEDVMNEVDVSPSSSVPNKSSRRLLPPQIPRPFIIAAALALVAVCTSLLTWFIFLNDPFVRKIRSFLDSTPLISSPPSHTLKVVITTFVGFFTLVSCFFSWFAARRRGKEQRIKQSRKEVGEMEERVKIMMDQLHESQTMLRSFSQRATLIFLKRNFLNQLSEEFRVAVLQNEEQRRNQLVSDFTRQRVFLEDSVKLIKQESQERAQNLKEPFTKQLERLKKVFNFTIREIISRRAIKEEFTISYQRNILTSAISMCLREEPMARVSLMNTEAIEERRGKIRRLFKIETQLLLLKLKEERASRGLNIIAPERIAFDRLKKLLVIQREEIDARENNITLEERREYFENILPFFIQKIDEPVKRRGIEKAFWTSTVTTSSSSSSNNVSSPSSSLDDLFEMFVRHSSNLHTHSTILKAKIQFLEDEEQRIREEMIMSSEYHDRSDQIDRVFIRLTPFVQRMQELQDEESTERRKLSRRELKYEFSDLVQEKNIEYLQLRQKERLSSSSPHSPNRRGRSIATSSSRSQSKSPNSPSSSLPRQLEEKENTTNENASSSPLVKNMSQQSLALCSSIGSIDSPAKRRRRDEKNEKRKLVLQYLDYKMKYLQFSLEGDIRNELEAGETFQRLDLKQNFIMILGALEEQQRKRREEELAASRLREEEAEKSVAAMVQSEEETRDWWKMREESEFGEIKQDLRLFQVQISVKIALFAKEALARDRYLRTERKEWRSILREAVDDEIFDQETVQAIFSGGDGSTSFAMSPIGNSSLAFGNNNNNSLNYLSSSLFANTANNNSMSALVPMNLTLSSFDGSFGSFASFLSPTSSKGAISPANNNNNNNRNNDDTDTSFSQQPTQQQEPEENTNNLVTSNESSASPSPTKKLDDLLRDQIQEQQDQQQAQQQQEASLNDVDQMDLVPVKKDELEQTRNFEASDRKNLNQLVDDMSDASESDADELEEVEEIEEVEEEY